MNAKQSTPISSTGKKPWVIVAITVGALLVLSLLLLFGNRMFAGKAIEVTAPSLTALTQLVNDGIYGGAEGAIQLPKKEGSMISIPVWVYVSAGKESVAYLVGMEYDSGELEFVDASSDLVSDWGADFFRITPTQGAVTLEQGTLNFKQALKGGATGKAYRIATVNFKVLEDITEISPNLVQFSDLILYDLDSVEGKGDLLKGKTFLQPSGQAECTAPDYSFETIKSKITTENMKTLCSDSQFASLCKKGTFNADLNKDGKVDGQDAFLIFKTKQSVLDVTCGGLTGGSAPCVYNNIRSCDDGSFRIEGDTVYNKGQKYVVASGEACPYVMEDN